MTNVRNMDGEPWAIAQVAGDQTVIDLNNCVLSLSDLHWAVRGAWLSQEYYRIGQMPTKEEYEASPIARQLRQISTNLETIMEAVRVTTISASWDPRSP